MYQDDEILELTSDIGPKKNRIKKGTLVKFVKAVDPSGDLSHSLVAIQVGEKVLVTRETNVRIKSWWRRRKAFKQFNKQMMENHPRLRKYYGNYISRAFYTVYYWFADRSSR